MIRSYDMLSALRSGLAGAAAIETWCVANYGRRQVVHVGWDFQRAPTDADCPMIVLRPGAEAGGPLVARHSARAIVNLCLYEARTNPTATAGQRSPECLWVEHAHDFANLVWTAMLSAWSSSLCKWPIKSVSCEYNDAAFPLIEIAQIIEVEAQTCLGAAEPTLT
jgi:hypothetical protein